MNLTLIFYSILILITFLSIGYFFRLVYQKRMTIKQGLNIFCGLAFSGLIILLVDTGKEVNEKMKMNFDVPMDIYADYELCDNTDTISDAILYKHLTLMRAPHAKIILAQAKLESANFTSYLYKNQHNFIGMKNPRCRVTTAGGSDGIYKGYNTWQDCVNDYIFWQFSHRVDRLSDDEYLSYLGAIYAEAPNYVDQLKIIMNKTDYNKLLKGN